MGETKLEDLDLNCLLCVLQRVGIESLLLDVPFVCKSWYKVTLSPSCWKFLAFPRRESYDRLISRLRKTYRLKSFEEVSLIKLVIDRSQKNATLLNLPDCATEKELKYAADECPALTTLELSKFLYIHSRIFAELISKWKNLEVLKLGYSDNLTNILAEIRLNCKNFKGLCIHGTRIYKEDIMAIINNLPNIKYLSLKRTLFLSRENLIMLLLGCKQLVLLDVRDCTGFEADQTILELASHIKNFKHQSSELRNYDIWDADLSMRDFDEYNLSNDHVYCSDWVLPG